jgi:ribosomal protein S12 methylthiotransferase
MPKVGFVSLGCPKALVDSEAILTQLRAEGYDIAPSYEGSDLVVVNTCGFIDAAVQESLDAIGEALHENGRVIVTGCLGAKGDIVRKTHPKVLAVTGPHAKDEVMTAVHAHLPKPHDPFVDLVPPQGIRLTPKHYAYLKISEGCNHRCTFCIIPSMRGDLESRPIGAVMQEAENLVKAGVKELLVISQDTSAYGVDVKYRTGFWGGKPVKTRMTELCRALGELGVWVRLHYVYPYPHVDEVIPLMSEGKILPYLDVPFQHASPRILKLMKRPASTEKNLERIRSWRAACADLTIRSTFIAGFPGRPRRNSRRCCSSCARPSSIASAASPIRPSRARRRTSCPARYPKRCARSAARDSCRCRPRSAASASRARSAARSRCWWTRWRRPRPSAAAPPMPRRSTAWCA